MCSSAAWIGNKQPDQGREVENTEAKARFCSVWKKQEGEEFAGCESWCPTCLTWDLGRLLCLFHRLFENYLTGFIYLLVMFGTCTVISKLEVLLNHLVFFLEVGSLHSPSGWETCFHFIISSLHNLVYARFYHCRSNRKIIVKNCTILQFQSGDQVRLHQQP